MSHNSYSTVHFWQYKKIFLTHLCKPTLDPTRLAASSTGAPRALSASLHLRPPRTDRPSGLCPSQHRPVSLPAPPPPYGMLACVCLWQWWSQAGCVGGCVFPNSGICHWHPWQGNKQRLNELSRSLSAHDPDSILDDFNSFFSSRLWNWITSRHCLWYFLIMLRLHVLVPTFVSFFNQIGDHLLLKKNKKNQIKLASYSDRRHKNSWAYDKHDLAHLCRVWNEASWISLSFMMTNEKLDLHRNDILWPLRGWVHVYLSSSWACPPPRPPFSMTTFLTCFIVCLGH